MGGAWGVASPIFSNLQDGWSKDSQASSKRVGHNIFCDLSF